MAKYEYNRYKIIIDPESKKIQGLRVGDVVRRQYKDSQHLIYSLMVELEIGTDLINSKESHYFVGALLEGDTPKNGELKLKGLEIIKHHHFGAPRASIPQREVFTIDPEDYLDIKDILVRQIKIK